MDDARVPPVDALVARLGTIAGHLDRAWIDDGFHGSYKDAAAAKDAATMREAAAALVSQQQRVGELERERSALRKALLYYATAQHLAAPDFWDSCSGEHPMWQFPDEDHVDEIMIEGGWVALQALEGKPLDFLSHKGELIDVDEDAAPPVAAPSDWEDCVHEYEPRCSRDAMGDVNDTWEHCVRCGAER